MGITIIGDNMKKLILVLAVLAIALPCFGATATWQHDGINVDGFTLYFWQTDSAAVVYKKTVESGTARTMDLKDEYFVPNKEYRFTVEAYNIAGPSRENQTSRFTWWSIRNTNRILTVFRPKSPLPPNPPATGQVMKLESAIYKFVPVE